MITILVAVLVACLVFWAVNAVLAAFGVGDPIATVVRVAFVLIIVLYLISALGYGNFARFPHA